MPLKEYQPYTYTVSCLECDIIENTGTLEDVHENGELLVGGNLFGQVVCGQSRK